MKLSVALAAYNGAPYITEQLLSILNQERPADEVILVDDGSTDGTDRIINTFLERYQPKNWYFFRNEKNLGYVRNFRRALSRTTGDLILLCDQDDIWYSHKTKLIEELFLSHPEIRVLDTSFQLMNEGGNNYEVPQKRGWINNNLLRAVPNREGLARIPLGYVLQRNISCGCTMAFTSSVRNVYLKHSHGRIQHDWEINILGALQRIVIPEYVGRYAFACAVGSENNKVRAFIIIKVYYVCVYHAGRVISAVAVRVHITAAYLRAYNSEFKHFIVLRIAENGCGLAYYPFGLCRKDQT